MKTKISNIIARINGLLRHNFALLRAIAGDFFFEEKPLEIREIESFSSADWTDLLEVLERDGIISAFSYEDERVRAAIWEIKYARNAKILESIGSACAEALAGIFEEKIEFENFGQIIIVPIPCHTSRMKEKGFNQAIDLAREFKNHFPLSSITRNDLLIKTKDTLHQTKLSRNERLKNLKGVFEIERAEDLQGKTIILIDDVTTTGATLSEAKIVLEKAGAKKVYCFAATRSYS